MKIKLHYFWYYTLNGELRRATNQTDEIEWADHEKVIWKRAQLIGQTNVQQLKQKLRAENWNFNNTVPIKEYHIEITEPLTQ